MSHRTRVFEMSRSRGLAATPLMSLVDVVFLLMTFFLFANAGLRQGEVVADLSRSGDSSSDSRFRTCWLTIRTTSSSVVAHRVDGGPWLGEPSDVEVALSEALDRPDADGSVTIDALPGVEFQSVIDAFALAERGGCHSVALRAESPR